MNNVTIKAEMIPTFSTFIEGIGKVETADLRINFEDLKFLPKEANPRSFHEGTTTKKIEHTIQDEPKLFEVLNRGLTIVCSDCLYEKGGLVTFIFTDNKTQGLVDGGHSFEVAIRNKDADAKIMAKVIYGDGAVVLANRIAESFNTTEKVKEMSLNNLRGYFDFIKKELINQPYYFDIKWEENAKKRISCSRIIGLMNSFDPDRWGHGNICSKSPTDSYNSARHTQIEYGKFYEKYGETTENPYYAVKKCVPTIIDLFDYIEHDFIRLYNKVGRYQNVTVMLPDKTKTKLNDIDKDKKHKTTFSNEELPGYVPTHLIYALIAPMRIFMERDKDGFWYFISDPRLIFQQIGPRLIKLAIEYYPIWNPNSAMKDPKFWTYLYDKTILLKNELK